MCVRVGVEVVACVCVWSGSVWVVPSLIPLSLNATNNADITYCSSHCPLHHPPSLTPPLTPTHPRAVGAGRALVLGVDTEWADSDEGVALVQVC